MQAVYLQPGNHTSRFSAVFYFFRSRFFGIDGRQMIVMETTISSKGQLVIPKYLRDALGLKPGSAVMITKVENKLILVPKPEDPVKGLVEAGQHIAMKNIRRHIKEE